MAVCADCKVAGPRWTALGPLVPLCAECAGEHRRFGRWRVTARPPPRSSRAVHTLLNNPSSRAATHRKASPPAALAELMAAVGDANVVWEARLPPGAGRAAGCPAIVARSFVEEK